MTPHPGAASEGAADDFEPVRRGRHCAVVAHVVPVQRCRRSR